jgi:esterase/lipase
MMKLFLLLIFLPLIALGTTWDEYIAQKKATVSHERHLPYRLTHGHKTQKSVLLIHGTYSSPLYFRGMAEAYFNAGHNVVTILLPGHWDKDFQRMKKITHEDWSRETDIGYQLALELGDEVILSGHSLGGLLSVEQALKRHDKNIHSLVLLSPSLKIWKAILAVSAIGRTLKLDGNNFTFSKPDGIQNPSFDPVAAHLIQSLADRVLKRPLTVPVFMAFTWSDQVVDVRFVNQYFKSIPVEKRLIKYKLTSGIFHGDISQSPSDVSAWGAKPNPLFDILMGDALNFVETLPK